MLRSWKSSARPPEATTALASNLLADYIYRCILLDFFSVSVFFVSNSHGLQGDGLQPPPAADFPKNRSTHRRSSVVQGAPRCGSMSCRSSASPRTRAAGSIRAPTAAATRCRCRRRHRSDMPCGTAWWSRAARGCHRKWAPNIPVAGKNERNAMETPSMKKNDM